jgi:hypothetical protein
LSPGAAAKTPGGGGFIREFRAGLVRPGHEVFTG